MLASLPSCNIAGVGGQRAIVVQVRTACWYEELLRYEEIHRDYAGTTLDSRAVCGLCWHSIWRKNSNHWKSTPLVEGRLHYLMWNRPGLPTRTWKCWGGLNWAGPAGVLGSLFFFFFLLLAFCFKKCVNANTIWYKS